MVLVRFQRRSYSSDKIRQYRSPWPISPKAHKSLGWSIALVSGSHRATTNTCSPRVSPRPGARCSTSPGATRGFPHRIGSAQYLVARGDRFPLAKLSPRSRIDALAMRLGVDEWSAHAQRALQIRARHRGSCRAGTQCSEVRGGHVNLESFSRRDFLKPTGASALAGTDHGTSAPVFVAGNLLAGGFYGDQPSLSSLVSGNLAVTTDFRDVYGAVPEDLLATPSGSGEPRLDEQTIPSQPGLMGVRPGRDLASLPRRRRSESARSSRIERPRVRRARRAPSRALEVTSCERVAHCSRAR